MDFFRQLGAQLRAVWNSWTPGTRIMMVSVMALLCIGILTTAFMATRSSMDVLFSELTTDKAADISAYLKEQGVPFDMTNNGTTIRVPSGQSYSMALQIASGASGIRFRSGEVGFEVFDKPTTTLGMTEKLMDIQYQRAITGQLQRIIASSPLVSQCQVQLTIPPPALFKEQKQSPRASVMVKLRGNIGQDEVRAIQNIVSAAVPELKAEEVIVTDSDLRTLSTPSEPDSVARLSSTQQNILETRQNRLEQDALQLLTPILGPGNANVQVSLDLDFAEVTEKSTKFGEAAVLSEQETKKDLTKRSINGVPGTESNTVEAAANLTTQGTVVSQETTKETITNNDIPKIVRETKEAPGKIVRMTVSALLKKTSDKTRTDAEKKDIENLIKQAVGYKDERDSITVQEFDFATASVLPSMPFDWNEALRTFLPVGGLVILVLVAAFMLMVSMRKPKVLVTAEEVKVPGRPKRVGELSHAELGIVDVADLGNLAPEEQRRIKLKDQVGDFAEDKPDEVAQIIRTWMAE